MSMTRNNLKRESVKVGGGLVSGLAGGAATYVIWYSGLGLFGKIGVALGLVSTPVGIIGAVTLGTLCGGYALTKLVIDTSEKDAKDVLYDTVSRLHGEPAEGAERTSNDG